MEVRTAMDAAYGAAAFSIQPGTVHGFGAVNACRSVDSIAATCGSNLSPAGTPKGSVAYGVQ